MKLFFRKTDAEPKKEIRSCGAFALTSVMSKWYAACIILRLEKEKEPEGWKRLHVRGIDGISCQHVQVMVTHLLQKHMEWQEDRRPMMRHGSVIRPAVYLAFGVARPKHIARIMDDEDVHGWIVAALLREMAGVEGLWRVNSLWHDAFAKGVSKPPVFC